MLDPSSVVALPRRYTGPIRLLLTRLVIALGVLALSTLIVYVDRGGYRDSAGTSLSLLDSLYYATVSLSTTGYGDIVPVTPGARLLSVVLITPLRLVFLLVLVGTTLEVLTATARAQARSQRWRNRVRDHTVVVGYGTKGRSSLLALCDAGEPRSQFVVIETDPDLARLATEDGAASVNGDATLTRVLERAEVGRAARIIVATHRDDTSVLVTLTARQLNSRATIVASVREAENESLLLTAGANSVVVSSETAGRLLGVSAMSPATGQIAHDLLSVGTGLELIERPADPADTGRSLSVGEEVVLGVVRDGRVFVYGHDQIAIAPGDRLVVVRRAGEDVGN
ncbi:MAG: TrkA-N domain protein [Pseudonocardiales bacterium]|nr:TrkA-N domain protein [Pseudonocardiales bacterium]